MNELMIRVSSSLYDSADVTVNGNKEKFVKNSRGSYELNFPSDGNVEIKIERRHELLSPAWLFWGLLFFVISCFGIFDVPYSKRSSARCKVNVTPNGKGAILFNPNVKKDGRAVLIESKECTVEEFENASDDKLIKKRLKTLRIIKLLLWIALIAAIVLIIIL